MTGTVHAESTEARQRVRVRYEKGESIKFISHQDEFRAWERALRRADVPLLYKQGFNPQPHIQFASPLGVGFTGVQEVVDITFSPPIPLIELRQRIAASLPPGLTLHSLEQTPLKGPAMQSLLIGADYSLTIYARPDEIKQEEIEQRVQVFLDATEFWRTRERKGRSYCYNLRPLVLELDYRGVAPDSEEHRIFLRVQQRAGATGRPDEVISELGLDDYARSLCRDRLYFEDSLHDLSQFAKYPVVAKEEIASLPGGRPRHTRKRTRIPNDPQVRSISERAGDEFG